MGFVKDMVPFGLAGAAFKKKDKKMAGPVPSMIFSAPQQPASMISSRRGIY